ncbi:MAG: hypothetical protein H8D78_03890, partial [Chloroflexi bacterium]|nr:hypothetical protein [Chloroflexota bacterium]
MTVSKQAKRVDHTLTAEGYPSAGWLGGDPADEYVAPRRRATRDLLGGFLRFLRRLGFAALVLLAIVYLC